MSIRTYFPGLFAASSLVFLAYFTSSQLAGGLVLHSLIFGFFCGQVLKVPKVLHSGLKFGEKFILNVSIVLMGAGLSLGQVVDLGWNSLVIVFVSIVTAGFVAMLIGRLFALSRNLIILSAIGNAICGASAIAAAAPLIKARKEEVAVSIGIVNGLGTLWMFLLPILLINVEWFDAKEMSQWIGATLQAVGQVSGAGYAIAESVGKLAVTIKLGRVIMLGPVLIILGMFCHQQTGSKIFLPWFIIGFLVMMISRSLIEWPDAILAYVTLISKILLALAMTCMGWNIQWADIKKSGLSALIFNSAISVMQIGVTGCCIYYLRF